MNQDVGLQTDEALLFSAYAADRSPGCRIPPIYSIMDCRKSTSLLISYDDITETARCAFVLIRA
jgi:hypothetical protein